MNPPKTQPSTMKIPINGCMVFVSCLF